MKTYNLPKEFSSTKFNKIKEYDCLCIGTSMILSLEACYEASKGSSVLMVDKSDSFGGAWRTISINGIDNVENAIHYFLPDKKGIKFLKDELGFLVEPSRGKYRYFKFLNLFYLKIPYSFWIGRLASKILLLWKSTSLLNFLKNFYSTTIETYKEKGERSFYTQMGSAEMLTKVRTRLNSFHNINILFRSTITRIYFDQKQKKVFCQIGDKIVVTKLLIFGHGARLPLLESSSGNLQIIEKFHNRPAYHMVIEDKTSSNVLEVIMNSDELIKYVHNVSRFTSLCLENKNNRKVFVFALKHDIKNHKELCNKLLSKLKDIKIISKNSRVIESLYSDEILPTIYDEDLYKIKEKFGDMVTVLRTENFAKGIGYYSNKWKNS